MYFFRLFVLLKVSRSRPRKKSSILDRIGSIGTMKWFDRRMSALLKLVASKVRKESLILNRSGSIKLIRKKVSSISFRRSCIPEVEFEFIIWVSSEATAGFHSAAHLHINKQWKTGSATARMKISSGFRGNSGDELKLYLSCFRNTSFRIGFR